MSSSMMRTRLLARGLIAVCILRQRSYRAQKPLLAHLRSDESLAYRTHIVFQFRSALATSVAIAPVHRGVAFTISMLSAVLYTLPT
jgi:hypothetical protein